MRVEIPTATRESKNRTASKGVANLLRGLLEEKVSESTKIMRLKQNLEATIICIEELENVDESVSRTKKHIAKMNKFKKEREKIRIEIDNVSRTQTSKHKEGMDLENVKNKIVGTIQRLRDRFYEITQKLTLKGGKQLKNKRRNIRFTKKPNHNKFRETIRKTFQKNKKRKTCKKYKITRGNNRNHVKHKKTHHKQRKHSRKGNNINLY
jgi:PII-like signaling protein